MGQLAGVLPALIGGLGKAGPAISGVASPVLGLLTGGKGGGSSPAAPPLPTPPSIPPPSVSSAPSASAGPSSPASAGTPPTVVPPTTSTDVPAVTAPGATESDPSVLQRLEDVVGRVGSGVGAGLDIAAQLQQLSRPPTTVALPTLPQAIPLAPPAGFVATPFQPIL